MAKSEVSSTQKMLNIWAIILIIWSLYRATFKTGLPIWIGPFEANAIAMKLKKMSSHRPATHDLIHNLLKTLQSHVVKIVVNDLKDEQTR